MSNTGKKNYSNVNYETLAFENVKSRHLTRFVNFRKYEVSNGLSDVIPLFIGYENCLPNHSFGPFGRSSYLIHYVTSGKGVFIAKGKKYNVKKGEAFIIMPDEITTYTADKNDPWSYVWIAFNGSLASELKTLEKPVISLREAPFIEVKNLVLSGEGISAEIVSSIILRVFADAFNRKRQNENIAKQIENYIKTQYMTDISVDGIALAVGLDRRYVGRLFKNETGVSVQDFIINVRLDRAKYLLSRGYKVREASVMSGYKDPFNFTKMFTKRFGVSPRAYAKNNK